MISNILPKDIRADKHVRHYFKLNMIGEMLYAFERIHTVQDNTKVVVLDDNTHINQPTYYGEWREVAKEIVERINIINYKTGKISKACKRSSPDAKADITVKPKKGTKTKNTTKSRDILLAEIEKAKALLKELKKNGGTL